MDFLISRLILFKNRIRKILRAHIDKEKAYIKKLLFPIKLFPLKLIVYFFYYPIRISATIIRWLVKSLVRSIIWPFRSFSNLFKTLFWIAIFSYFLFTEYRLALFINEYYGGYRKFFCPTFLTTDELRDKTLRIVGSYSQGSGFFISDNEVVTNFHVIEGEASPKIVLPNEKIITPYEITGDKNADIAVLKVSDSYPDMVTEIPETLSIHPNEVLIASGYALGSDLPGRPTVLKGNFVEARYSSKNPTSFIQTTINLVPGMSGGPLSDKCGEIVGINTIGLSGLSLFIPANSVDYLKPGFSQQDVSKIEINTSTSEGAVQAFYTYIKARDLESAFDLLSKERKSTVSSLDEWTKGYANTLQVNLIATKVDEVNENKIFVKLESQDWIDGEMVYKYFEGYWSVIEEDGNFRLDVSNIAQIESPPSWWSYYWEKPDWWD